MADLTRDAPLRFWDADQVHSEKWVLDNSVLNFATFQARRLKHKDH